MRTIPHDKANHFIVGVGSGILSLPLPWPYCHVPTVLVAFAREAYNVKQSGNWRSWSWADIAWTIAGDIAVKGSAYHGLR